MKSESLKLLKEFETNKIGLYQTSKRKIPENQSKNEKPKFRSYWC